MNRLFLLALLSAAPLCASETENNLYPKHIGRVVYELNNPANYGTFGGGDPSGGSYNVLATRDGTNGTFCWVAYRIKVPANADFSAASFTVTEQLHIGSTNDVVLRFLTPFSSAPTHTSVKAKWDSVSYVTSRTVSQSLFDGSGTVSINIASECDAVIAHSNWDDYYVDGTGGWIVILVETTGGTDTFKWNGFDYSNPNSGPDIDTTRSLAVDWRGRWQFETEGANGRWFDDYTPDNQDCDVLEVGGSSITSSDAYLGKGVDISGGNYLEGDTATPVGGPDSFTFIVTQDNSTSVNGTVASHGAVSAPDRGWEIEQTGTTFRARAARNLGGGLQSQTTIQLTGISTTRKYIVYQLNDAMDQFRLRCNGSVTSWTNVGGELNVPINKKFTVADLAGGGDPNNWAGKVYFVAWWTRVLLDDELAYFYNNGNGKQE